MLRSMKPVHLITVILIVIIAIIIGLVAYSYAQIQFGLESISYQGLDFASLSTTNLFRLVTNFVTGDWMGFALTLVTGVKMSLVFGLGNHGLIPIYIPDVSYDILVNGIKIGRGVSHISSTINPGETKTFQDNVQDIKFASIEPAITSIVDSKGMVNFQVNGIAYFVFLGVHVPIPFHSSIQVNMLDEIKNHFNRYLSSNQSYLQNSFPENQGTVLGKQPTKENSSTVQDTGNPLWNNFSHGTAKVGDVDLNLEVGDTPDLMQQGLQLQPRLPYNQGMFFVFKTPTNVPIWMPNMKFSIDVIWFDGKGNILRIEKNVPPCILSDTSKCTIYGGMNNLNMF